MIDTHVHLGGGKYAPAEEWDAAAARLGVDGAVIVQNLGNSDNAEILAAARSGRTAVVGIPASIDAAPELLEAGAVGFRLGPRGLHSAEGDDRVFAVLDRAEGVASITMPFDQIASGDFAAIVDAHPRTTFRLEHIAAFDYSARGRTLADFAPVVELARRPNVVMMWSGYFVYSVDEPPYRDAWPVLEASLDAFGPERIVWSGDWNRAGGTDETYLADVAALASMPFVDDGVRAAILDTTPRRIFRLDEGPTA